MTICKAWGQHVVYMLYNVISSRTFYFLLSSPVINVVIIPSDVTDVINHSNPNPRVLKIEKCKIIQNKNKNEKENKINWSSLFLFLIYIVSVTNFIQLIFSQLVDQFSQTKLYWKAPNEGYLHIYVMYKINNKQLRYQAISNCKFFVG